MNESGRLPKKARLGLPQQIMAEQPAGDYTIRWNGTDDASQHVGAGLYVYRLSVGTRSASGKLVLLP